MVILEEIDWPGMQQQGEGEKRGEKGVHPGSHADPHPR
jgi:hypothetical protein